MGQDIHAVLQARGEPTITAGRIGRDHNLFSLIMGLGAADELHEPRGLPDWMSLELRERLLSPRRLRSLDELPPRRRAIGLDETGRVHPARPGAIEPIGGWWLLNPDWHSFTWMDLAEASRVHGIWARSIDYGHTHCRVKGYEFPRTTEDPEDAEQWLAVLGPEVEVPWFESWRDIPGPRITNVDELRRIVMLGLLPVPEIRGIADRLIAEGHLDLTRHAHRPPDMGDDWRPRGPHPVLSEMIEKMRDLEERGRSPQLVFWFDN